MFSLKVTTNVTMTNLPTRTSGCRFRGKSREKSRKSNEGGKRFDNLLRSTIIYDVTEVSIRRYTRNRKSVIPIGQSRSSSSPSNTLRDIAFTILRSHAITSATFLFCSLIFASISVFFLSLLPS